MRARTVLEQLSQLSDEQLDLDLTVYTAGNGEYFPVDEVWEVVENGDVLDVGSIVFVIQN